MSLFFRPVSVMPLDTPTLPSQVMQVTQVNYSEFFEERCSRINRGATLQQLREASQLTSEADLQPCSSSLRSPSCVSLHHANNDKTATWIL